jgi:transposase
MYGTITRPDGEQVTVLTPTRMRFASRHWDVQEKRRIVEETMIPGVSVSRVARRHDVNCNLVFRWRREYERGEYGPPSPAADKPLTPDFVSVGVIDAYGRLLRDAAAMDERSKLAVSEQPAADPSKPEEVQAPTGTFTGRVELQLPGSIRITFDAGLDETVLRRLMKAVKELA